MITLIVFAIVLVVLSLIIYKVLGAVLKVVGFAIAMFIAYVVLKMVILKGSLF